MKGGIRFISTHMRLSVGAQEKQTGEPFSVFVAATEKESTYVNTTITPPDAEHKKTGQDLLEEVVSARFIHGALHLQ